MSTFGVRLFNQIALTAGFAILLSETSPAFAPAHQSAATPAQEQVNLSGADTPPEIPCIVLSTALHDSSRDGLAVTDEQNQLIQQAVPSSSSTEYHRAEFYAEHTT